jgi:alpha-glucosidase
VNPDFVSEPFPKLGQTVRVSLRMRDETDVVSVRLRRIRSGRQELLSMQRSVRGVFSEYSADVLIDEPRVHYHFIVETSDDAWFFSRNGARSVPPLERHDFEILANLKVPAWVPSTVFYLIVPDRFARAETLPLLTDLPNPQQPNTINRAWHERPLTWDEGRCLDFFNGDLAGIVEKLPYLLELGVGALCLTPIFKAISNHRYDIIDFSSVDPRLGGDAALAKLSRALHAHGLRLILDITPNHTSREHPWFTAAQRGSEPERGFYHFYEDGSYAAWSALPEYPKLNYASDELRERFYRQPDAPLRRYLQAPFNVDGFRFDVAHETGNHAADQLGSDVFREIRCVTKAENSDCYLLGEHQKDPAPHLRGDEWDAAMNYFGCSRPLRWFFGDLDHFQKTWVKNPTQVRRRSGAELAAQIIDHLHNIPSQLAYFQYNLFESHDCPRFHHVAAYSATRLRGLLIMMFVLPGAPSIYYGSEVRINGGVDVPEEFRYPMPWDPGVWDQELRALYRELCSLKAREEALHFGSYRIVYAAGSTLAFARFTNTKLILAIVSNGPCAQTSISLKALGRVLGNSLRDALTHETVTVESESIWHRAGEEGAARLLVATLEG